MDLNLEQKKVLVTGVASGIGHEQAKLFLENGASVVGIDKDECDLQDQNFSFYQIDITNIDALKQVLNEITAIDIVCNTAGILDAYHSISQTSFEEWNQVINTNLTSQFVIVKELLPLMIKQQAGVFINMASIAGKIAGGGGAAYTASKHAVIGFTKQLNFDYAKNGIRANCIAPGAVMTNMNSSDFNNGGEIAEMVKQSTPAQRYATAKEIAELTIFLASDKAQYIYGETITIDGGWSIDKII